MNAEAEEDDRIVAELANADWCKECDAPIGQGVCDGCAAAAGIDDHDREEPCCIWCGKPLYDCGDYGCGICDVRMRF